MVETYEEERRRVRVEKADAGFARFRRYLGRLSLWDVPAFVTAVRASDAIREYRDAHGQQRDDHLDIVVAVNAAARTWAREIQASAAGDPLMDPVTVATIVAGLLCPSRPYCTGCPSCQTVTAPHRPCTSRGDRL